MADILDEFQPAIESIKLVPSTGGVFDVSIDDERHAEPDEVIDIFRNIIA